MPNHTPAAILFDAVGTLIYPDPPAPKVYQHVGAEHGVMLSLEETTQRFRQAICLHFDDRPTDEANERRRWQRIVAEVFHREPSADDELFKVLWAHFGQPANWRCFDDVEQTWQALEDRGYFIAIASNFDERLFTLAAALEPLNRARHVFVSSQVGYPKPRREFFAAIEHELQLSPHQLLLVGDDYVNDVQGAKNAGWRHLRLDRNGDVSSADTIKSLCDVVERIG